MSLSFVSFLFLFRGNNNILRSLLLLYIQLRLNEFQGCSCSYAHLYSNCDIAVLCQTKTTDAVAIN